MSKSLKLDYNDLLLYDWEFNAIFFKSSSILTIFNIFSYNYLYFKKKIEFAHKLMANGHGSQESPKNYYEHSNMEVPQLVYGNNIQTYAHLWNLNQIQLHQQLLAHCIVHFIKPNQHMIFTFTN